MVYSNSFQILLTAGFENDIYLLQIHPLYHEFSLVDKLVGHGALVTALEVIEGTPIVLSADDAGSIKLWDIRSCKCIQNLVVGEKVVIYRILSLFVEGSICFCGSRLNLMHFDNQLEIIKRNKQPEQMHASCIEYVVASRMLVVSTRKDLRFIRLADGRLNYVYKICADNEDEIAAFKGLGNSSNFLVGNQAGEIVLHSYITGERKTELFPHSNEVISMTIDRSHQLLMTAAWDNCLKIQKIAPDTRHLYKEIRSCFGNRPIT